MRRVLLSDRPWILESLNDSRVIHHPKSFYGNEIDFEYNKKIFPLKGNWVFLVESLYGKEIDFEYNKKTSLCKAARQLSLSHIWK